MGEMTALKYLQEKSRMTRGCKIFCDNCLLDAENNGKEVSCGGLEERFLETAISIVQEWADEHPRKTILQDFLEKYPKVPLENGVPKTCLYVLGYMDGCGKLSCGECWNRQIEEE